MSEIRCFYINNSLKLTSYYKAPFMVTNVILFLKKIRGIYICGYGKELDARLPTAKSKQKSKYLVNNS